ncbi:alcohol oxidase [Hymenopellis radicata]|nr:alcohol oxidase [Hymenopellis radicata]
MPLVTLDALLQRPIDVLIAGGGTSGLTLARRLAQGSPQTTVAVLEAGVHHDNDPLVDMPGMLTRAIHNPDYDWTYYTVPQKHAANRSMLQTHGKGLGGSSLLNFMCFIRPSKEEFDALEELGNTGWNWDNLLHYMKKSERLQAAPPAVDARLHSAKADPEYHGTEGAIAKSYPSHVTEIVPSLLDALEAAGVPRKPDPCDGRPVGGFLCPTSVDVSTSKRSYAASDFFTLNKDLPNLLVVTNVSVSKINFEGTKATGVTVQQGDKTGVVNASKEVILSAGSLHTPQILELSGIGNASIIEPLGIKSVVDLPGVGENLQDHIFCPIIIETPTDFKSFEIFADPEQAAEQQALYQKGAGLLAGFSCCSSFIPASVIGNKEDVTTWSQTQPDSEPDLFPNLDPSVRKGIEKQYEFLRRWIQDEKQPFSQLLTFNGHFQIPGMTPDPSKRFTTIATVHSHPFTRGRVHITSSSSTAKPDVNPRYLANPMDLDALIHASAFVEKLCQVSPLKDVVKRIALPDENGQPDLDKFVREYISTVYHPIGTAAMLPKDLGGVVDPNLKVYGTENLRVADCSIAPLLTSSNTQTYAYAIGEKAADIILASL